MSEWVKFKYDRILYRTNDGVNFEWFDYFTNKWLDNAFCKSEDNNEVIKEHYKNAVLKASQTKTYEQLEMEANIKKLEWTIAEQQLEIERLRQKELELTKGKNNE